MAVRSPSIGARLHPRARLRATRAHARARRLPRVLTGWAASIDRGAAVRALLTASALAAVASLLFPATASAGISEAITEAIRGSLDWVVDTIVRKLFGTVPAAITNEVVSWLVAIPNFDPAAQQPYVDGPVRSSLDGARQATTMLALGGLSAVVTLSVLRYWLSGLSMRGSGGIEAFEGLMRTLLAVGLILLWPEAFRLSVALANSASDTLLNLPNVKENLVSAWGAAATGVVVGGPVGLLVGILIAVAFAVMLLMLLSMKIMLTAGTAVLYVLMPIPLVLMPLPELAWLLRIAGRAFVVCLITPLGWCVIFVTFGGLGVDVLTFQGQGGFFDRAVVKPLVLVAVLRLAIMLGRSLGKAALAGAVGAATGGTPQRSGGAGFIARMGSTLAARRVDSAIAQQVPQKFGGRMQPPPPGPPKAPPGAPPGAPGPPPPSPGPTPPRPAPPRPTAPSPTPSPTPQGRNPAPKAPLTNGARVQAAWRQAFGRHNADPGHLAFARDLAHAKFSRHASDMSALLSANDHAGAQALNDSLVAEASGALSHFSRDQQVAMAASVSENVHGFAWNTANSESSPAISTDQSAALRTLGGMPRNQLQQAFEDAGVWEDGMKVANNAPSSPPQPAPSAGGTP